MLNSKKKEIEKLQKENLELEELLLFCYNRFNEISILIDDEDLGKKVDGYRKKIGRKLVEMNCYEIL